MEEREVVAEAEVERRYGGLTEGQQVAAGGDRPHVAVLRLLVSPQVNLPLEGPAAEIAGERFVAGVLPGVSYQVAALTEGFPAHHTLVRLLSYNNKYGGTLLTLLLRE